MKKTLFIVVCCLVCLSGCSFLKEIIGDIFGHSPTPTPTPIPTPSPTATPVPEIRTIRSYDDYICYETQLTIRTGIRIEFDAQGYVPDEPMNGDDDQLTILVLQDVPRSTNWHNWANINGFLLQTYKLAYIPWDRYSSDGMKLKIGAATRTSEELDLKTYRGHGLVGHPLTWNSKHWYHWSFTITANRILISRDGTLIWNESPSQAIYGSQSQSLVVFLGGSQSPGFSGSVGVSYKNISISAVTRRPWR